jgi:hypothetical protein
MLSNENNLMRHYFRFCHADGRKRLVYICFGETGSFVPQDDREYVVIIIIDNLYLRICS